jgi:hypothetical protein
LLASLSPLVGYGSAGSAAEPAAGTVMQSNHVTLFVQDVAKSVAFYQLWSANIPTEFGNA